LIDLLDERGEVLNRVLREQEMLVPHSASVANSHRPVLIVEDHDDTRTLLETYLALEGFSVLTAACGPEALRLLEDHPPCIILLDLSMPDMDGIMFSRELRQHPDRVLAETPIVLFTAVKEVADAMRATGAVSLLRKPADPPQILEAIQRFCRR
jgi:CheY-like chemotaxis protein